MNASDTNAVDPRDDGSNKADQMDRDATKPILSNKTAPKASPGPDTREEPYSPK